MATRVTIAANVQINLESNSAFYSTDDYNDSIQDAYNIVAAITKCIVKTTNFAEQAKPYWDIAATVTDFLYIDALWNPNISQWLKPRSIRWLNLVRWDWELWSGNPQYFYPIDFSKIAIAPHLSSVSANFHLIYRAAAPTLADGTTLEIPEETIEIIEQYVTADLLEQAREFKKASKYWKLFYNNLKKTSGLINSMYSYDKLIVMYPYNPLPRFA